MSAPAWYSMASSCQLAFTSGIRSAAAARTMKSLTDSLMAPAWLACARSSNAIHTAIHRQVETRHGPCFRAAGDGAAHALRHATAARAARAACGWPAAGAASPPLPRRGAGCGHAALPATRRSVPPIARPGGVPAGWTGGGQPGTALRAGAAAWRARVAVAALERRGLRQPVLRQPLLRQPLLRRPALPGVTPCSASARSMAEASSPSTTHTVFTAPAAGRCAEHAGVFGVDLDDGLLGLDFGQRVADGDRVAFLLEPLVRLPPEVSAATEEA